MGNIAHLKKKFQLINTFLQSHDYTMIWIKTKIYKSEKLTDGRRTTVDQISSLEHLA